MRKVIVVLLGLLVFCSPSLLIGFIGNTQSCGGFEVYSIDPPQPSDGTVIHLTENDFRDFPRMVPIIRDAQYTTGTCRNSMYYSYPCVGKGWIPCKMGSQFGKYQDKYLEYEGRFYFMERSYYT